MDATRDDRSCAPSLPPSNANAAPEEGPAARAGGAALAKDSSGASRRGETEILDGREANPGMLSAGGRTTAPRRRSGGGAGAGGEVLSLLPYLSEKGSGRRQSPHERARAVAAVPYPTMRSLRLA